ncbi:hypothetical protein [Pseudomonas citronellolis]|uniref:hypothetical protein n=1 Tax=Pseudomonas citronellolis TaxID=53408 RepID=UPI0023E36ACD|nr:hypothetical protein [Pseudomonas citronellolis]MDF3932218.1 hypothetical protein [Pseudomonas citronellolis]
MKGTVKPRKSDYEGLQFVRWVLMVVVASRAAGMRELNRGRLHVLLFQSFASSLYYGIKPLRQRAQRTVHGPYYRAAHIAVGKLVLSGLATLEEYNPLDHKQGIQFDGKLSPTPAGLKVVHALRATKSGELLYRFLLDLCLSTVEAVHVTRDNEFPQGTTEPELAEQLELLAQASIDDVLLADLSYQRASKREGVLLQVVENPDDIPLTVRGLREVAGAIADGRYKNRRDVLTAYQFLLRQRVA